ncbi:transcription termination factor Rho [Paraoerskovia marina]|uniref:transcription termination factor Rho n=1 Tax=Paraoerskovia marina TaxID=545619 RepID=UPI000492B41A|nr:transcription termination factor Rho [Paraoerskovia marina]
MTDTTETAAPTGGSQNSRALGSLRIPELQAIASQMGVKGTSKMRKSDLVAAISSHGGSSPSAPKRAPKSAPTAAPAVGDETGGAPAADAPQKRSRAPRGDAASAVAAALSETTGARAGAVDERVSKSDDRAQRAAQAARSVEGVGDEGSRRKTAKDDRDGSRAKGDAQKSEKSKNDAARTDRQHGGDAGRGQDQKSDGGQQGGGQSSRQGERQNDRQGDRQGDGRNQDEGRGSRRRRGRDRGRDRKRSRPRGPGADIASLDEVELQEDDVLLPVAGILDIMDNYAFVRTSGYLPGNSDVYVSLGQVKKSGLRRGDAVTGAVRQPRDGETPSQGNSRINKFNALVRLDTINGMPPEQARQRADFGKLTPLYPQERLRLENTEATRLTPRIIDIVAPIGKGQRGLIVAPPKAGKTIIMQQIANAITTNNPEVHLMVVLVDERPEEVTDMERTVKGEVIASTFDRPASDHTIVAELAIERAKRLVELGQDVVVLLDSLTRLSRAYNLAAPASGRILSGGVDASALYPPKRFFGAARNIENGGSLTILASALVETGSKMDEVIFEEFKGTGNMELRLSRNLADKRIFPAVDVNASGTRREEVLLSRDELGIVYKLRRVMGALDQQQAIELLLGKLKDTSSNVEFLLQVQKTTPANFADGDQPGRTV